MTGQQSMDATIDRILGETTTIAVVGLSTHPEKAAHSVPAAMQAAGFTVIPVHPTADRILGQVAYRSLGDIPAAVDLVDVFRPADEAPDIARQAVRIGARALWLQLGLRSDEARRIATEAGLDYVEDRCLAVEHGLRGGGGPAR
ncbi:CoA-binding protein [Gandjariella thermophila]|uniref:Succinyl-CoA ligase subunit alpha n=1 Tax=Gandjariella thermophila TaxID=1931992 RepID=A0A4D4J3G8_9PSEU|nr:CoA-binding protein [Gandjariella thermophila]GDY29650.1 succinyl-CoA ligase subunit alpha [Gandjariella thermophila]